MDYADQRKLFRTLSSDKTLEEHILVFGKTKKLFLNFFVLPKREKEIKKEMPFPPKRIYFQ